MNCYCLCSAPDDQQVSSVSHSISAREDNDDEEQDCNDDEDQQQYHRDDYPNIAVIGRLKSTALTSEAVGDGESFQISSSVEENVQNDAVVQDDSLISEATAIQEESETGASKPQERVVSQGGIPVHTEVVTGEYIKLICVLGL